MFGFPVKVSWPNIASLPRNVSSSSQQIPSEVSDFPIPIAFSKHWGGVTPPPPTPPAIYVPGLDVSQNSSVKIRDAGAAMSRM